MGGFPGQPPTREPLRALLESQHGVVARRQLRAVGLGDDAIDSRCRSGSLVRVARGVYAAGHGRLTDRGRWTAAVLSCGDGAVLSHRAAAVLWGIWGHSPAVIDVTVPRGGRESRPGIALHRSGRLGDGQVARSHGIPVTSPTRTLVDVAEVVERRVLERALDEVQRLRLCSERELRAGVERNPGRAGAARIAVVLAEHELGSTATVNEFEEAFLALCDGHGIERPEVNVPLGRYRVDFLWREPRLIVETDGYATHGTRRAFESDHERDVELGDGGWRVRRFTWRQLVGKPEWVASKVRAAVEGEPGGG